MAHGTASSDKWIGRPGHRPDETKFRPVRGRDLLTLAGDIGVGMKAWPFVERELETSPVVYVPGSHEYCTTTRRAEVDANWRGRAKAHPSFHHLLCEGIEIGGVRFWGAPWHSEPWGVVPDEPWRVWVHLEAQRSINDFWVGWGEGE